MGTKPGVGEDSVILDLPSEAGAPVETDHMLSALAPSSRDFVERVPVSRSVPTAAAGRSAKTRVAGVPVMEAAGTSVRPPAFGAAGGPSTSKRIAAFGASLGLSFVIGLPVVLKVDGVMGEPPTKATTQPVQSAPSVAASPTNAVVVNPPPQTTAPQAMVAPANPANPPTGPVVTSPPASPATAKGSSPKSSAGSAKTSEPATPTTPPTPATAHVATSTPAAPTPPPTPAPSSTLSHGALIQ